MRLAVGEGKVLFGQDYPIGTSNKGFMYLGEAAPAAPWLVRGVSEPKNPSGALVWDQRPQIPGTSANIIHSRQL